MSTTTLSCSGATYLSNTSPTADNSSASSLRTSWIFANKSHEELVTYANQHVEVDCAIFRFTKTNTLKYKKINRVILSATITSSNMTPRRYAIAPYKSDAALSGINFSSYQTLGALGEWITTTEQGSNTFSISVDITSLFNSNIVNDEFNIAIAANTLPYAGNGSTIGGTTIAKSSVSLTVEYETVTQLAPTPLYPKDVTLLEARSMLFSWQFNAETEAVQSAVQLEYKKSTDADYTVLSLTTTAHSYTVSADFTPGTYYWRLKATNDIAETSGYSEVVSFNVIGKPAAPIIATPANKTLTSIEWTAAEQYACEIRLLDADQKELVHETLATSVTAYKPNMFLMGNYTFLVRIKNASDLWSDWAQIAFSITAAGPAAASMIAIPENDHARLEFTIPSGTSAAVIRYDDKGNITVLAMLLGSEVVYEDDTICPDREYAYAIRTYVNGYTDSTLRRVTVNYSGAIMKADDEYLHLQLSEEQWMPHSEEIEQDIAIMRFTGRTLPLTERGEFMTVTINKRFYLPLEEKAKLDRFSKAKSIFYRDFRGNAWKAAITGVSYDTYMSDGYIASIKMIRTAEDEVIINV